MKVVDTNYERVIIMKNLKKVLLLLVMICLVVSVTDAATVTSYTASASPGDAVDGNGNTVDVWTVTGDGGAGRSFLQGVQDGNPTCGRFGTLTAAAEHTQRTTSPEAP